MKPSTLAMLKKAGVVLPEPAPRLAAGTLIVAFAVDGRPIPWSVPYTTRTGRAIKDRSLVAWQETVQVAARMAMGNRAAYPHPVEILLEFDLVPIKGRTIPDTSNLTKGLEDALQGIVIENDRLVARNVAERRSGLVDGARVWIYAWEE